MFLVRAKSDNNMTRGEVGEDEENPPFLDYETISRPRRIALFVEPSPFAWVLTTLLISISWKIMGLVLVSCIVWLIFDVRIWRWLWVSLIASCLMKRLWQFHVMIFILFSCLHLLFFLVSSHSVWLLKIVSSSCHCDFYDYVIGSANCQCCEVWI